jgi:hypothetical protein
MFRTFVAALLAGGALLAVTTPILAQEKSTPQSILFNPKILVDMGDIVHVEGQITGNGIGYKINRAAMTCYRERMECILTRVDTQGWQAFSIGTPLFSNILSWDKDLIVADLPGLKMVSGSPCSDNPGGTTWYIHRDTEVTEIQENFCNPTTGDRKFYKWTIEDDPHWHQHDTPKQPAREK